MVKNEKQETMEGEETSALVPNEKNAGYCRHCSLEEKDIKGPNPNCPRAPKFEGSVVFLLSSVSARKARGK